MTKATLTKTIVFKHDRISRNIITNLDSVWADSEGADQSRNKLLHLYIGIVVCAVRFIHQYDNVSLSSATAIIRSKTGDCKNKNIKEQLNSRVN